MTASRHHHPHHAPAPALGDAALQARTRVLQQIKDDHTAFKRAWRRFRRLDTGAGRDAATALVEQVVADLHFHAHFEHAHLYPAVNAASADRHRTVLAEAEHDAIDALLARLQTLRVGDPPFAELFRMACDQVQRHVRREEAELLPLFETAPVDWPALDSLIRQRDTTVEPTMAAVLQAEPDDLLNPVHHAPVDDHIEPARVLSAPDTPARRRAAAHRAPVK